MENKEDFSDVLPADWVSTTKVGNHSTQKAAHKSLFSYECVLVETSHGAFEGTVTLPKGYVSFVAKEVSVGFKEINCVLSVSIVDKEAGFLPPFRKRQLNVKSNSTIKDFISSLKSIYKEQGYKWDLIVELFLSNFIEQVADGDSPLFLTGEETHTDQQFLLYPFLQKDAATLLFADGDTGKTWFSLRLAISLATGEPFMSYPAPTGVKTLFLDYEDSKETFSERVRLLSAGIGKSYTDIAPFLAYKRMYSPLYENVEHLRQFILEQGISFIILDAGADAAGGDAIDSESVLKLFNGLVRLSTTALVIHHEPKNATGDKNSHYGSMYWKNRARIGWRLQKENDDSTKLIKATLTKKNNIKEAIAPFYYTYREIDETSVIMEGEQYQNLPAYPAIVFEKAQPAKTNPSDAVVNALEKHKELTYKQLAEMTESKEDTVKKLISRNLLLSKLVEIIPKGKGVVVRLREM